MGHVLPGDGQPGPGDHPPAHVPSLGPARPWERRPPRPAALPPALCSPQLVRPLPGGRTPWGDLKKVPEPGLLLGGSGWSLGMGGGTVSPRMMGRDVAGARAASTRTGRDAAGARAASTRTGRDAAGARADSMWEGGGDRAVHPGRQQELGVGFRQERCPGVGGGWREADRLQWVLPVPPTPGEWSLPHFCLCSCPSDTWENVPVSSLCVPIFSLGKSPLGPSS